MHLLFQSIPSSSFKPHFGPKVGALSSCLCSVGTWKRVTGEFNSRRHSILLLPSESIRICSALLQDPSAVCCKTLFLDSGKTLIKSRWFKRRKGPKILQFLARSLSSPTMLTSLPALQWCLSWG